MDRPRRGLAIQADSADPNAIRRAVSQTLDTLGGLDILVNSAGIGTAGMTADLALADLQAMLDVNVRAPVLFAQAAIPHLSSGGRIISIGSALAERLPFPGVTAYAMSKSALLSLTRGLSRALRRRLQRLICPSRCPGVVLYGVRQAIFNSGRKTR